MRFLKFVTGFSVLWMVVMASDHLHRVLAKSDPDLTAPAIQLSRSLSGLAQQVKPSVVSVFTTRIVKMKLKEIPESYRDQFLKEFEGIQSSGLKNKSDQREFLIPHTIAGSGMVLDMDGHILTNLHLVHSDSEINVLFHDRKKRKARLVGLDSRTDLAVIRIEEIKDLQLVPVKFGDSDEMKVGEMVLAVGTPFGLPNSFSYGIISATGRTEMGFIDGEDFIQTDAAINPGNSGGPLLNMRGEVIGVNSAIASLYGNFMGIGLSVPINPIKEIIPRMIRGEAIKRAELGVWMMTDENSSVVVMKVIPGSAADRFGIKMGDQIVSINDEGVRGLEVIRKKMFQFKPGEKIMIQIQRAGKTQKIDLALGSS